MSVVNEFVNNVEDNQPIDYNIEFEYIDKPEFFEGKNRKAVITILDEVNKNSQMFNNIPFEKEAEMLDE